ncbi:MAG: hypothetical protein M3400_05450 [Actinomycetota bacterium]|nr:hypothetical protein [Actinomycetota bacterium]
MRVAFVGKGGAGKSSIAGVFARLLARRGERVLALDSDPMPGLAYSLGVPSADAGIPAEAVEEYDGPDGRQRYRLRAGLDAAAAIERYATISPDGVRLVQLGKARGVKGENSFSHNAFQGIIDGLAADDSWNVVGDLPGGTRQPFFGWGRYARTVLVVVEPTPASLLSGRRLARLAQHQSAPRVGVIANKIREPSDVALVERRTGLPVIGQVPNDDAQGEADRRGVALLDLDSQAPMVSAIESLVSSLAEEEIAVR